MALLAAKPPMGWNAWNYFGPGKINETVVRETADAMVEQGFRDAGYVYVSVDDCWMSVERDANGDLQADPVKFPSGMKALGDYIHERGLKFGLYAGAGVLTYAGRAGSYGYERQDARKFAEWGVDLLKYDFGYVAPGTNAPELFRRMGAGAARERQGDPFLGLPRAHERDRMDAQHRREHVAAFGRYHRPVELDCQRGEERDDGGALFRPRRLERPGHDGHRP